jgi:hypothetical protein
MRNQYDPDTKLAEQAEGNAETVVDFSKLKLEVYDFLGLILPGLLAICEAWILLEGWRSFIEAINQISGTGFTLLIVLAFGVGHIAQELGDFVIKALKGKRYFRQARDNFWETAEAQIVRDAIKRDFGQEISSVDTAFDYCLTKLKDRFSRRDIFVATSDLCRSLVLLSVLALIPATRIAFYDMHPVHRSLVTFSILALLLLIIAFLAWKRMVRFREFSDTTVFRAYLAIMNERAQT